MIKTLVKLQDLRRRIYRKAKSEPSHRFWGLFVHIAKMETLEEAYCNAKRNGGAPGIDGQSFEDIETRGRTTFLVTLREDLVTDRYKPMPNRRVDIPKGNGKVRTLQIPCIRDRVVQGAVKLILEAIFEADFCSNSYGFRPQRSPHRALAEVRRNVLRRMSTVIDVDLSRYFDTIRTFSAARQDREAGPGPAGPASRKTDRQSWRKDRGPARGARSVRWRRIST